MNPSEYRLLVENAPVMVWRAGLDAKCDYFNETWLAYTGRTLEQEMGDRWAEGVHPDDLQRCVAYYLDHFQRRVPFEMEYRLRRHDGAFRWIFDRGVPFTDDAGRFAGFIGSCVDVDERRRAQDAQQQHARDFEKWILAIVVHDIRNPLGTVQLAARYLQETTAPDSPVRKTADLIARGSDRIQHIVADLLDLSRAREGAGLTIEPRPADLRTLCRQIIDELEPVAKNRSITLEGDADGRGAWDEHRILQALSNLVSNALQHGTPGSPVRIRLAGDEERLAVEVRNEGGISEEVLPRLFEPFRSARHYTRRGEGLGLGLFIAKAIAHAHGGELEVETSRSATVFRLVLPRRTPVPAAA